MKIFEIKQRIIKKIFIIKKNKNIVIMDNFNYLENN